MAEFLIKAISATHPNPDKDRRGCYKRGDIVVVMPDNHKWGNAECLPTFVIVKIPGLGVETAKKYVEPAYVLGNETFGVAERRKWRILVDSIPAIIKNTLLSTGQVTVTLAQVRNYIEDRLTGLKA